MPSNWVGQMITFAAEIDPDAHHSRYIHIRAGHGDSVKQIAAKRGHPELAADILTLNKGRDVLPHPRRKPGERPPAIPRLRSVMQTLRANASIRIPGTMAKGDFVSVNAGDAPPIVTAGYAKYDIVDVTGRTGINRFLGYDPIALDIAVQFESYASGHGDAIETGIETLERFAGRGPYAGAAVGPPAVIRISATDEHGLVIPLIPADWQWSSQHQNAPLFRISAIAWDAAPLRNEYGIRTRQAAVVSVTQYTPLVFVERSVSRRTQTIPSKTSQR